MDEANGKASRIPAIVGPAPRREALLVGIDNAPPAPMQLGDPERGDFRGYEVDLLKEVARRLDVVLHYRRAFWSVIVDELASGALDLVCSAATVTEERCARVDFCDPYLALTLAVVAKQNDPRGGELDGRRVGVRRGTTAEAQTRARSAPAFLFVSESNEELYTRLSLGELDAVVDDSPIAEWFARQVPGLWIAGRLLGTEGQYAVMVRKGDAALRDAVNGVLAELKADGTWESLYRRWFDEEIAR